MNNSWVFIVDIWDFIKYCTFYDIFAALVAYKKIYVFFFHLIGRKNDDFFRFPPNPTQTLEKKKRSQFLESDAKQHKQDFCKIMAIVFEPP